MKFTKTRLMFISAAATGNNTSYMEQLYFPSISNIQAGLFVFLFFLFSLPLNFQLILEGRYARAGGCGGE